MAKGNRHRKWFAEAVYDLRIGKTTYEWPDRSLMRCGYYAHQCIEKSLKGYLIYLGFNYPKSHDLGEIAELVLKKDNSLQQYFIGVQQITPFYLAGRYPDAIDEEAFKNIESKIEGYFLLAKTILDELLARVNVDIKE